MKFSFRRRRYVTQAQLTEQLAPLYSAIKDLGAVQSKTTALMDARVTALESNVIDLEERVATLEAIMV